VRRVGIDTCQEPVLYMRQDCPVCVSEGFEAQSRVEVTVGARNIVATLNVVGVKVYGRKLTQSAFDAVIGDIAAGRYSDLQLAAFVTCDTLDHATNAISVVPALAQAIRELAAA
jgi:thymidine phosphorylase